jgi:hypothetical protein
MVTVTRRGGNHVTHDIYLGGGQVSDTCIMPGSRYRFSTQCQDEKYIAKIERNLTEARDSTSSLKFNGKLDLSGGTASELDKDRFVREIGTAFREHGQQVLFTVDKGGTVRDIIRDHRLFTVLDVINIMTHRMDILNVDADRFDQYELDDLDLSRTLVDSKLSHDLRERIRVRYDHRPDFYDLPGSVTFMMALDICNASQAFDVEGDGDSLESLSLDDYPGENVTYCAVMAQEYIKIMQGEYALPVKTRSKVLSKFTKTSSEEFSRKVFAMLDTVKQMEKQYKLADPKSIVVDTLYHTHGPIAFIALAQKEHTDLITDRYWTALTAQLPESNNTSMYNATSKVVEHRGTFV